MKSQYSQYRTRDCFPKVCEFVEDKTKTGTIMALYGLRRTGKTVILKQIEEKYGKNNCYYLECNEKMTMQDIYDNLDGQMKDGKTIALLDEITSIKDFVSFSAYLADIYGDKMSIIIAGTDSLGLSLAEDDKLLGRVVQIDTTYVPFAEHSRVLQTKNIDEYIRFGGLMREGMKGEYVVKDYPSMRRYLDSAVAGNIVNSLAKAPYSTKYREVRKYTREDIEKIINKLVEIYSGTFDAEFINNREIKPLIDEPFDEIVKKSADESEREAIAKVDREALKKEYVEIINASCKNLSRPATELLIEQLESAFYTMNVMSINKTRKFTIVKGEVTGSPKDYSYHIIQPAIKYYQLKEAVDTLKNSGKLDNLPEHTVDKLADQLTSFVYGQIMEEIVLFDTGSCLDESRYDICKPSFTGQYNGEYDMLVRDKETNEYYIFEIKHSNQAFGEYKETGKYVGQDKHLVNDIAKKVIDEYYGKRKYAFVLYNGVPCKNERGTYYANAADFLISLDKTRDIEKTCEEMIGMVPVPERDNRIDAFRQQQRANNEKNPVLNAMKSKKTETVHHKSGVSFDTLRKEGTALAEKENRQTGNNIQNMVKGHPVR